MTVEPIKKHISDIESADQSRRKASQSNVDYIADMLVAEFGDTRWRELYCKVGWKLPRGTIDRLVMIAKEKGKKGNGGALFNYLAKHELTKTDHQN